jgi:hypothetical protein
MAQQNQEVTGSGATTTDICPVCSLTYSIFSRFPSLPSAKALNVETGEFFPLDRVRSMSSGHAMTEALGYSWTCDCRNRPPKRFNQQSLRQQGRNERAEQSDDADMLGSPYGNSPRTPQNFGGDQPLQYAEGATGDNVQHIAVRGVSAADEAECDAMYEARMKYCSALSTMYGRDMRTYLACKEQAFQDYQACRGYR